MCMQSNFECNHNPSPVDLNVIIMCLLLLLIGLSFIEPLLCAADSLVSKPHRIQNLWSLLFEVWDVGVDP